MFLTTITYFQALFRPPNFTLNLYARDEATDDSYIDIFVKMKPILFDMIVIKEKIEEDLHKKVDIIREHKNIKPFFLEMINRDLIYT